MNWKRWVRRIHLWLALIASLPLVVLAVTGAWLVFPEETRRLITTEDLLVEPRGEMLRPTELIAAIEAKLAPDDKVRRLQYPKLRNSVMLADTANSLVAVDPYSGEVRRVAPAKGDFNSLVTSIHVSLLMGETGTWITGTSSLLLVVLCFTGLWLWWPVGRWKAHYFLVRRGMGWRRLNFDLHRATGLYLGAFLFIVALTGAAIAFYEASAVIVYGLTGTKQFSPGYLVQVEPRTDMPVISPDVALQNALEAFPGHEPHRLYLPSSPKKPYRIFIDPPGEHEVRSNEVRIEMDPYTGKIIQAEGPQTMSAGDKILRWVLPLHYGTYGGTWTKVLYVFVSLSPVLLSVTGLTIWMARRRKQRRIVAASNRLETSNRTPEPAEELAVAIH